MTRLSRSLAPSLVALVLACTNPPVVMDVPDSRVVLDDDAGPPACIGTVSPTAGPCRCSNDCPAGALCQTEEVQGQPMGACVFPCTGLCPTGERCTSDDVCSPTCTEAGQCAPGRYCFGGTCTTQCAGDSDCFSGHCDPNRGRCTATPETPEGARTGEACLVDGDCRSNFCISGACVTPCVVTHPFCPEDEACVSYDRRRFIEGGVCAQRCDGGVPCRNPTTTCIDDAGLGGMFCE